VGWSTAEPPVVAGLASDPPAGAALAADSPGRVVEPVEIVDPVDAAGPDDPTEPVDPADPVEASPPPASDPADDLMGPETLLRSFLAHPLPLKWTAGAAKTFDMGPPQRGHSRGPSAWMP
jgi:hypothetical protein